MNGNELTLRSSIRSSLMTFILFKGTIFASLGGILWMASGAFLPPHQLKIWGLPLFLIGLALITYGWLPYKRLRSLEVKPYLLTLDENHLMHFSAMGKPLFSLPCDDIAHHAFVEKKRLYGIAIWLKDPLPKKIIIRSPNFDFDSFRTTSLKRQSCDLFLPYFSKHAYQQFESEISGTQEFRSQNSEESSQ